MMVSSRLLHYTLLLLVGSMVFLPGLGTCPLWDVDEAHNAECAREMLDSGNWVVPTFNFALRTDKPVLLYWIMMALYSLLGVGELAARLGSAISGIATMLATCELGRRMFDARTGLLAGVVLGSCVMFCVSSRAATPDALLIFWVTATLLSFWVGYDSGSSWWLVWCGFTTAMACLAKGAVGLVLPVGIIGFFLVWERRLDLLWNRQLLIGALLFAAVCVPWYVAVGVETKGAFLRGFFLKHHVERFQQPLEGHAGSVLYHPFVFLLTFAPWSSVVGATLWAAVGRRAAADRPVPDPRTSESIRPNLPPAYRLLWCWIGLWFLVFSVAGTKLPNYTLPAFPAFALLTARFLIRWADGLLTLHRNWMLTGFAIWSVVGLAVTTGLVIASGQWTGLSLVDRVFPELIALAPLGLVLSASGVIAGVASLCGNRWTAVVCLATAAVVALAGLAAWGPEIVARHRAPLPLARAMLEHQMEREVEIACFGYYQPSLVWYTQRQVKRLEKERDAVDHLHSVKQTYLILPRRHWQELASKVSGPAVVVASHWDFMANEEIVLVTNRASAEQPPFRLSRETSAPSLLSIGRK